MQAYGSFSKAFKDLLVLGTGVEHDSTLLVGENLAINQGFCDKKNCPTNHCALKICRSAPIGPFPSGSPSQWLLLRPTNLTSGRICVAFKIRLDGTRCIRMELELSFLFSLRYGGGRKLTLTNELRPFSLLV